MKKIIKILEKNRKLILFLVFAKSFILGGTKGLKRKKEILLGGKKIYIPPTQKLSEKPREYQTNYPFVKNTKFSILVPLYNTPKQVLTETINSVLEQTYENFELCLVNGSDSGYEYIEKYCTELSAEDDRIIYKKLPQNKGISENTNECIGMSSGNYIALFDHDDLLHPSALFEYAKVIEEQNADFIYCDEDKFAKIGKFFDPYFKPDFAIDNLRANNYICHFTVFKKSLLHKVGGFRKEFDGSQDHDIILRLTEKAEKIVHIPKILYRWRVSNNSVAKNPNAKTYTSDAGIRAVNQHFSRLNINAFAESSKNHPNFYRIKYKIEGNPLVSILIPNYNHIKELSRCINSIIQKTTYKNYEIVIIENNSNKKTFDYYETLKSYPNIKIVIYNPPTKDFNYSAINNYGIKFTSGEHIILLNNDVEVITPDWIEEMLMFSCRNDIGGVGAMLYYPNDTIQHAGVILGVGGVAGHAFKYFPRGFDGNFGRTIIQQNYSAVTAACMMIKKSVFEEIGGFNEDLKVAFNDVDLCMRIRKAGYLIAFTPYCELYHYESISRGSENTPEKEKRFNNEIKTFCTLWSKELEKGDPYYNENLTLEREDFGYR